MAKVNFPYFSSQVTKGRTYNYYRRGGERLRLPGSPGSPEFIAAYQAADARFTPQSVKLKSEAERIAPKSIDALVVAFYRSTDFQTLELSTQRAYRGVLDRFRDEKVTQSGRKVRRGSLSAVSIATRHLESIFQSMANRPEAARNLRKRLNQVFGLAVRLGWRRDNPVRETKAPRKKRDAGIRPWTEDDISTFRDKWPSGTKQRLALELLLHTGQRRSDVAKMGPQHVSDGRVSVAQRKTQRRLQIRMHEVLVAELANHSVAGLAFITSNRGTPYPVESFGNWFRKACKDANLVEASPHGLRKAQGRRLAEAGCSEKQIAAILGNESLQEVARYTRDANTYRLADAAMDILETVGEPETGT